MNNLIRLIEGQARIVSDDPWQLHAADQGEPLILPLAAWRERQPVARAGRAVGCGRTGAMDVASMAARPAGSVGFSRSGLARAPERLAVALAGRAAGSGRAAQRGPGIPPDRAVARGHQPARLGAALPGRRRADHGARPGFERPVVPGIGGGDAGNGLSPGLAAGRGAGSPRPTPARPGGRPGGTAGAARFRNVGRCRPDPGAARPAMAGAGRHYWAAWAELVAQMLRDHWATQKPCSNALRRRSLACRARW